MIAFTIRAMPGELHKAWKTISSLKGISMRLYILRALRKQVEKDINSLNQETSLKTEKLEELS